MQTGIIYITPTPQNDIKILINGKEETNNLNVKGIFKKDYVLYNLLPKTYNIKITKAGYHPWEKNLVVLPGLIAYAQPLLLPSSPADNLIFNDSGIQLWSISGDFKKIFYLKKDADKISANVYDLSQKTRSGIPIIAYADQPRGKKNLANIISADSKIFIAPDGQKFALVLPLESARIILLNSAKENISTSADFILNGKILDGLWDDSSRYFFYLTDNKELYAYDSISGGSKKILGNILGFSLKGGEIYYIDKNNLFVYRSPINSPAEKQQLSYVPLSFTGKNSGTDAKNPSIEKSAKLIIFAKNALAVIGPDKNLFTVTQNGIPVNLGSDIESAAFSGNGEKLIYNSPFEIFTATPGDNQENLVTRLSQKISNVGWYGDYEHIWFIVNHTLKNIELDSRPIPNIVDFLNFPNNFTDIIYADSNTIYYDQRDGDSFALHRVEIKE